MKLHLPLGLLAAVLLSFGAATPRTQAASINVRTVFTPEDWVASETIENVFNLDLSTKNSVLTGDVWTIHFYAKNPSTSKPPSVVTEGFDTANNWGYASERPFFFAFQKRWAAFMTYHQERKEYTTCQGNTESPYHFKLRAAGNIMYYSHAVKYGKEQEEWQNHDLPYQWYNHLGTGDVSPIRWLSSFTSDPEEGMFTVEVESVKQMDESRVYTWTGTGNTVMGEAAGDMYDGYIAAGENDETCVMVHEQGLAARNRFGREPMANGEFSKLRFVAEGSYYRGAEVLRGDEVELVDVGTGVAITTEEEWAALYLGGLVVEKGATGYSLAAGTEGSVMMLGSNGNGTGDTSTVRFNINETFTLGAQGNVWQDILLADGVTRLEFEVAEDKIFTIHGRMKQKADVDNITLDLSGGGTLALRWGEIYYLGENSEINISGGSTLDMGGAKMLGNTTIINGSLLNAEKYEGRISVLADEECGAINLGGASADTLDRVVTTSSNTRVYNIGAGTLVIDSRGQGGWQDAPVMLQIGSQHLTEEPTGGTYLLEFNDPENSKISFVDTDGEAAKVVITLDDDLKFELAGGVLLPEDPAEGIEGVEGAEGAEGELGGEGNLAGGEGTVDTEPQEPEIVEGYEGRRYLWFSNADMEAADLDFSDYHALKEWFNTHFIVEPGVTLDFAYDIVEGSENGKIQLILSASHIYYSSLHGEYVNLVEKLNDYEKWHQVVVDSTLHVDLTPESASGNTIVLRYLSSMGKDSSDGGNLTITRNDPDENNFGVTVELNNNRLAPWGGEVMPDSEFLKDIVVEDNAGLTALSKVGEGTLTLGGNVTSKGLLKVGEGGKLVMNGEDSTVGALSGINGTLEINGTLTVLGNTDVRAENSTSREMSTGSIVGDGTLVVKGNFYAGSRLSGENTLLLDIEKGAMVQLDNDKSTNLGALSGSGTLDLNGTDIPTTLTLDGKTGVFTGNFVSDAWSGTIDVVNENTNQTFQNAGIETWDLKVRRGAMLTLIGTGDIALRSRTASYNNLVVGGTDMYDESSPGYLCISAQGVGAEYAAGTTVRVSSATFGEDAVVEFRYNFAGVAGEDINIVGPMIESEGNIYIDRDVCFVLNSLGSSFGLQEGADLEEVVVMRTLDGVIDGYYRDGESLTWDSAGIFMIFYRDIDLKVRGKEVVLSGKVQHDNIYESIAVSYSSLVGGALLWAARFAPSMDDPESTLYNIIDYTAYQAVKGNGNEASRVLSAVAGSTVPTLGTAQRDALRSQVARMRDHVGVMGLNSEYSYDELPFYHCWIEGAGHFAKLQGDHFDSGYKLNSWGGSVGADVDVDNTTSVGLALTAFYGDFTAGSADRLSGDMDSVYLSFIGRFRKNRWTHTLVAAFGMNDFSVERTVDYGLGKYTTQGETSGWGLAMMYEVTRDYALNEEASSVLQPLLNFSVAKTSLRGYNETGEADMGLNVGKQEWVTASVGVGARWLTEVGTSLFDRAAQLELRANVSQDLGDTRGEAEVALQANPGTTVRMKSAEAGTTALQLGIGLRVPLQEKAMIFTNASADIRSGMTTWNVSAGIKYDF